MRDAERYALRFGPWLLTMLIAVGWGSLDGPSTFESPDTLRAASRTGPTLSPPVTSEAVCMEVDVLVGISDSAVALTGALALIDQAERPLYAGKAAREVRGLAEQARTLSTGTALAQVLADLAEVLDTYAGRGTSADSGRAWMGLAGVHQASARHAKVRATLLLQQSNCEEVQ